MRRHGTSSSSAPTLLAQPTSGNLTLVQINTNDDSSPVHVTTTTTKSAGAAANTVSKKRTLAQMSDDNGGGDDGDSEDDWVQGAHDGVPSEAMGREQPPEECFGCRHLGASRLSGRTTSVENTRIERLIRNLGEPMNSLKIDQHCLNLAKEYECEIRQPSNQRLRHGELPLPEWTAATIKAHLCKHVRNPAFALTKILDQLDTIADEAYEAAILEHRYKRRANGKRMRKIDLSQWKVYKEAIDSHHKYAFQTDFKKGRDMFEDARGFTRANGSDFVDIASKNVYHTFDQMNPSRR